MVASFVRQFATRFELKPTGFTLASDRHSVRCVVSLPKVSVRAHAFFETVIAVFGIFVLRSFRSGCIDLDVGRFLMIALLRRFILC